MNQLTPSSRKRRSRMAVRIVCLATAVSTLAPATCAFSVNAPTKTTTTTALALHTPRFNHESTDKKSTNIDTMWSGVSRAMSAFAATGFLAASLALSPALAENELSAKYGGAGLDTSLVDQTCLVDKCSLQAKACLADDPSCRKGLTCTAKCLGDNACITGCMARYGNNNLDNLLKCTIEDNECIKVAILDGGADEYGQEPASPAPIVPNFDYKSLEGSWFKVVGYNPNYDCYACQRNSFSKMSSGKETGGPFNFISNSNDNNNKLRMDVEFSMPHLLPDGSPPPPVSSVRESILLNELSQGTAQSIGLNAYNTHEVMVFDTPESASFANPFVLPKSRQEESVSYRRTAHSEGEMFGLKFWENWYIIGENDPNASEEFKFIYYNGKTRQNTYEGAFIYSRTQELSAESMKQVYKIAKDAGMNPDQFCRIRNRGCFAESDSVKTEPETGLGSPSNPFRGIIASTRVSELLGVEPVAARDTVRRGAPTAQVLIPPPEPSATTNKRAWWLEMGDYLENPHRHFAVMDQLRQPVVWPEDKSTP